MIVKDITSALEKRFPLKYAEDFDNTGLLVGDYNQSIKKVLVTLDTTESIVEEAIKEQCHLIVSFHPIIFSGLKKLNGGNYVQRTVAKAIKNNISIFAIHTALDNSFQGVNKTLCDTLNLLNRSILIHKKRVIKKLNTYVPNSQANTLRKALFTAGAGSIGNYSHCSFNAEGIGSFKAEKGSKPSVGNIGDIHFEKETQVSVVFPIHLESQVLKALFTNHPYEEVAYEITSLDNTHQNIGMGMVGNLERPITDKAFLELVKSRFRLKCIRHSKLHNKKISKVAVLGGSGSFAIEQAKQSGADIFLTADISYHHFFKGDDSMIISDIGHYESEQYVKNLLHDVLKEIFPKFALALSKLDTNSVYYTA